jgi:hypothetical protein
MPPKAAENVIWDSGTITDFQNNWVNLPAPVDVQRGDQETQSADHGRKDEIVHEGRGLTDSCCSQAIGVQFLGSTLWLSANLWPAQRPRMTEY